MVHIHTQTDIVGGLCLWFYCCAWNVYVCVHVCLSVCLSVCRIYIYACMHACTYVMRCRYTVELINAFGLLRRVVSLHGHPRRSRTLSGLYRLVKGFLWILKAMGVYFITALRVPEPEDEMK